MMHHRKIGCEDERWMELIQDCIWHKRYRTLGIQQNG